MSKWRAALHVEYAWPNTEEEDAYYGDHGWNTGSEETETEEESQDNNNEGQMDVEAEGEGNDDVMSPETRLAETRRMWQVMFDEMKKPVHIDHLSPSKLVKGFEFDMFVRNCKGFKIVDGTFQEMTIEQVKASSDPKYNPPGKCYMIWTCNGNETASLANIDADLSGVDIIMMPYDQECIPIYVPTMSEFKEGTMQGYKLPAGDSFGKYVDITDMDLETGDITYTDTTFKSPTSSLNGSHEIPMDEDQLMVKNPVFESKGDKAIKEYNLNHLLRAMPNGLTWIDS